VQPALTVADEEEKAMQPHKRKRRIPRSFIVGGIVILAAVIYLVYANTQATAAYYMTVAELRHCTNCTAQSVRVAGIVQKGSIVRNDAKQEVSFSIADGSGSQPLSVVYSGIIPDIFAPGIQVVVEGHYSGQGPFQAQTLLAKCPSKFQVATPGS
jgi:cytochrome c-type biogenesis protein CcmE